MKIICFLSTWYGPSGRFRFLQYEDVFAKGNIKVTYTAIYPMRHFSFKTKSRVLNGVLSRFIEPLRAISIVLNAFRIPFYDVVYLNKDLSPNTRIYWFERLYRAFNKNLFIDIDDAIFFSENMRRDVKFQKVFRYFKGITVSNQFLAGYVLKYGNSNIVTIPMGIDMEKYALTKEREVANSDSVVIGWSGSDRSYDSTFPSVIPALQELAKIRKFKILIIKNTDPKLFIDGIDIEFKEWNEENEVQILSKIDIGLMPLLDNEFQRYKSALKALQYMAIGIPTLVSPYGVNEFIVEHGKTGFHCRSDEDWIKFAKELIDNRDLRFELGKRGLDKIKKEHAIDVLGKKYIEFFEE